MKPAICGVCGTSAVQSSTGDWVTFSDYKSLDNKEIGHPEGLEWFCESHLEEAKLLSGKTSTEALSDLRKRHPKTETIAIVKEKGHWWQRLLSR